MPRTAPSPSSSARGGRLPLTRLLLVALSMVVALVVLPGTGSVSSAAEPASRTVAAAKKKAAPWTPPAGPIFNSPFQRGGRTITSRVVKTINNTPKGELIRLIMYNIDDGPTVDALLRARQRGVKVQVITAKTTANPRWSRLARGLNAGKSGNFAKKCKGACRSSGPTVHSKLLLVSRIRKVRGIVMFGSFNLTYAGAQNQWNDLTTVRDQRLYDYFAARFAESRRDKSLRSPYRLKTIGQRQVTMYPVGNRNPILSQLDKVRCNGATGGYGNRGGHTVIRLAVAAWFDIYGETIAKKVRQLWERGCDIRVVTTLAGRGIDRALKSRGGRGPVPIKRLTQDTNGDGVPNRYLHMKAMSINGVFGNDRSAAMVLTGSPNWTQAARKADEFGVRILGQRGTMVKYQTQINRLFSAGLAHTYREVPAGRRAAGPELTPDFKDPGNGFDLN